MGLIAAEIISRHGFSVDVFEEHKRVGYPVHCAGMVSFEGLTKLKVKPDPVFHQNTIYGGSVFSRNGSHMTIRDQKPRAYIIDRENFDKHLAEAAQSSGAKIYTGKRVERIILKDYELNTLQLNDSKVQSRVIINAEGAGGGLLTKSGIYVEKPEVCFGFNADLDVDNIEVDMIEVWLDRSIAKDFFTWVIPINENRVRCGLATTENNGIETLRAFIKKRFNKDAPRTIQSGLVCIGGPINRTVYSDLMLVGDVAGQVKPTTGGGVIFGGLCAGIAGETIVRALSNDDLGLLDEYEHEWRKRYGSELQSMLLLRKLMNSLDDDRIDRVFHAFKEERIEEKLTALVEEGDMDMQKGVINKALTDPVILGALAKSLGRLAVSELLSVFGF